MRFGIFAVFTDAIRDPIRIWRTVEEVGFESLWTGEHSHVPVQSITGWDGRPTPEYRKRMLDPFLVLTGAASVTTSLRVGTCVCLVPQRDPIQLAKEVSTLDRLSGGRFVFGVGPGWDRQELANHGYAPRDRYPLFAEKLAAVKQIWTQETAAYHGSVVEFDALQAWPKPVQTPHPPILIGGEGPTVLDRVLASGTGWMPRYTDADGVRQLPRIADLQRMARDAGSGPFSVTIFSGPDEPAALRELTSPSVLDDVRAAGVERVILALPSESDDAMLRELERLAGALAPHPAA